VEIVSTEMRAPRPKGEAAEHQNKDDESGREGNFSNSLLK